MTERTKQSFINFEPWAHWLERALIGIIIWIGLEIKSDVEDLKRSFAAKSERDSALVQKVDDHDRRIGVVEDDIKQYHRGR